MSEKVTLKDIAANLGTSVATVSNALSGKKGVSAAMRKKIADEAARLKFDLGKYEKKENESLAIGVLVSEQYISVGTSFYWEMYQNTATAASKRNVFTTLEILSRETEDRGELPQLFSSENLEGLIIIGRLGNAYIKKLLSAAEVPVVLLDFYNPVFQCDAVLSNNYIGMYKATKYLIDRGHTKIGFIGTIEVSDNIRDRYYGFLRAMKESGLPVNRDWVFGDRNLLTGDYSITLPQVLPTAFACSGDYTAGHLYEEFLLRNIRIPEDISVTSYDDYLFGHPFSGQLTTFRVDMEKMAGLAVDILKKKIEGSDSFHGVQYVDGEIVERSSVRSLR